MKRIKRRALCVLVFALAAVSGLCIYLAQLAVNGESWAMFRGDGAVYSNGILSLGTLTDRNGVLLASAGSDGYTYAEDETLRRAVLHTVGDYAGNIGTGAVTVFADKLAGYSILRGAYASGGGKTVALTLDEALCVAAYNALGNRSGAVLLMNYETGEILCMVSSPGFDPADPDGENGSAAGMSGEGEYINRCISASYTPGSVFKLVTLTAALETLPDLARRAFTCAGSAVIDGELITCPKAHGAQTIEQAFANSCNCAFAALSAELGGETLAAYTGELGITGDIYLDGIAVKSGGFDVSPGAALAWSGIGQGSDLASPFSFMRLSAAIANGGILKEPTLLLGERPGMSRLLRSDTAETLSSMMGYNVAYAYGAETFSGLPVHAKTGTAEVGDGASHAWITGFLSDRAHPLAFAVIIEKGGGGLKNAGAVINEVLKEAVK